ncbi:unnamed protein product [Rotaria sp. Silwood1]|nr:unnamed protein product [Rotaria sp. Silwood1]CAF1630130.1 unnamed protein product [Rotaria sp. Silwood1]CAF4805338.1 unnamed protein product [Rotaria sp. Silwood1]
MVQARIAAASIVRDLSPLFVQLLNDANPSLIRKSLECLRNFSQSLMDDEQNIVQSFKYLIDKIQQGGNTDVDASLISLIMLFDLLLSHPSVSNNENHRFSIAAIISRTSLYPPKSAVTTIDKWTTKMWLGKLIGQNPTRNKIRYQSEKPFSFAPDSPICNILCDNIKYPIDITNQFDLFIEKARQHQHTNVDELIAPQNTLNQLFRCQFILQTFLNADQCLLLMLSFVVQCQRIIAVQITDKNNLQTQTETGTKLVTTFVKDLPVSTEIDPPPLISCIVVKNLFQSMINDENFPIDEVLLKGCLQTSLNWSIDYLCLLSTSLAIKLSEISSSNIDSSGHREV